MGKTEPPKTIEVTVEYLHDHPWSYDVKPPIHLALGEDRRLSTEQMKILRLLSSGAGEITLDGYDYEKTVDRASIEGGDLVRRFRYEITS